MDLNNLLQLQKSQIRPVSAMLARAFQDDPLNSYFVPDASQRKDTSFYSFEFLVRLGVSYGEVYATSPNLEGAAVWLPPDNRLTLWRVIRNGVFSLCIRMGRKYILRALPAQHFIFSVHKHHTPFRHWYLWVIGVDPVFQGKGYASMLMKSMLARIDQEHLPCYVDTQNENNVTIYQHYGFKIVEEVIIPNTGVGLWAMLREKSG